VASVADLVEEPVLRRLASAEAFEAGHAAADAGRVTLGEFGPLRVSAVVQDENGRWDVQLRSGEEGLVWSCTCPDGRAYVFCRHCVAAAVETWRRAPKRRGP
jgi:uncharacterized Zn finger protein